jgi:hypothetical protein
VKRQEVLIGWSTSTRWTTVVSLWDPQHHLRVQQGAAVQ